jgi:hypothetical protein
MLSLERVISTLFILVGTGLMVAFCHLMVQYSYLKGFDSVEGDVVHSEIVTGGRFSATKGGGTFSKPSVTYRFAIGAKTYTSNSVNLASSLGSFDFYNGSETWAQDRLSDLVVDGKVQVYYAQDDPGTSYLDNELAGEFFFLPAEALVLYLLGYFLFKGKLKIAVAQQDDD